MEKINVKSLTWTLITTPTCASPFLPPSPIPHLPLPHTCTHNAHLLTSPRKKSLFWTFWCIVYGIVALPSVHIEGITCTVTPLLKFSKGQKGWVTWYSRVTYTRRKDVRTCMMGTRSGWRRKPASIGVQTGWWISRQTFFLSFFSNYHSLHSCVLV